MERFFRSLKTEWMPKKGYSSYDEAETDTYRYIINHYNTARGHSYNNYLSPDAAEKLISSHWGVQIHLTTTGYGGYAVVPMG